VTEQDLVAIEEQLVDPNTTCYLCDPDTRALLAEVRRLKRELLSDCNWCGGEEAHEWDQPCPRQLRHDGLKERR
jgi:hypothetical protein